MSYRFFALGALCAGAVSAGPVEAGILLIFDDGSGLSAEAEFTLLGAGDVLQVRLKNTSTSIPMGFDSSDQLLTGVSWDFGALGIVGGDPTITGGSVVTGATSSSLNFDVMNVGPNSDVSGEYGYGNMNGTGALTNFVSGNAAQATPFGGPNLDGPANIDGPQGGLVSSIASIPLGGLGAIQDEIIATLTLSHALSHESEIFGALGLARVEFGSDAHFVDVPAPGAVGLLGLAGGAAMRRRR